MMPADSEQLEAISGIGAATMEQYGYDILQMIRSADGSTAQSVGSTAQSVASTAQSVPAVDAETGPEERATASETIRMRRLTAGCYWWTRRSPDRAAFEKLDLAIVHRRIHRCADCRNTTLRRGEIDQRTCKPLATRAWTSSQTGSKD